jgi:hypothetical protein
LAAAKARISEASQPPSTLQQDAPQEAASSNLETPLGDAGLSVAAERMVNEELKALDGEDDDSPGLYTLLQIRQREQTLWLLQHLRNAEQGVQPDGLERRFEIKKNVLGLLSWLVIACSDILPTRSSLAPAHGRCCWHQWCR